MGDHLARGAARRREAEAVDDVVEAELEEAVEGRPAGVISAVAWVFMACATYALNCFSERP